MNQDTVLPRFHARFLRRRRAKRHDFLLGDADIRFAAECERMRVDRNGSVLSILLITLPTDHATESDADFIARVLEGRLRATDSAGRLCDGRIAVLLPDTPEEGAWKVAADVSEVYPPGPTRPQCRVLLYPEGPEAFQENGRAEPFAVPRNNTSHEGPEAFFARATPSWKRALDISGATFGIALGAPVVAVAALAIKLTSRGPVFFLQEREGAGGRRFNIIKLRTMCVEAEERKEELRKLSQQDGPAFKLKHDPRTTQVGRFLRWTSIDELPQFVNVLKGEMSLVGPRPLPTQESQGCRGWQRRRLTVNPGMTCTWQVAARGAVPFDEWIRMDLRYAKKRSLVRDVFLVCLTIPSLITQKGMR